jgi:hypothetical protein
MPTAKDRLMLPYSDNRLADNKVMTCYSSYRRRWRFGLARIFLEGWGYHILPFPDFPIHR